MNAAVRLITVTNSAIERADNPSSAPYANLHTRPPIEDAKTEKEHRTQRIEQNIRKITRAQESKQMVDCMDDGECAQENCQSE